MNQKTLIINFFGYLGFLILLGILIYLILRVFGVISSLEILHLLLGVVIGQVFYNGYNYAMLRIIKEDLEKVKKEIETLRK